GQRTRQLEALRFVAEASGLLRVVARTALFRIGTVRDLFEPGDLHADVSAFRFEKRDPPCIFTHRLLRKHRTGIFGDELRQGLSSSGRRDSFRQLRWTLCPLGYLAF